MIQSWQKGERAMDKQEVLQQLRDQVHTIVLYLEEH